MLRFPINIPRQSYRGQSKSLARFVERWNSDAAALETYANALALEETEEISRYSFERIAEETGYEVLRVRELFLAAGCNGCVLSIAKRDPQDVSEYLEKQETEARGESELKLATVITNHAERPLRTGDRVAHPSYGEGVVSLLLAEATVACVDWDDLTVVELRVFTSQLTRIELCVSPMAASAACSR
ncbi:hypothetical protein BV509_17690 [Rhodovulum sulfidophilum]|uniref:Uncharacterized protein n=1 Tax=Rhodovulum visakhapatnamense TaxID=364297 RepID=A0ABS1RLQ4_9RHOB|nr:hypothetical protein [Rhodovulum visakhapatnamense]MBL3571821.1 hypothetical protein [Rhodovulum visakhapatnamense]MBL3580598.1 hypothetical protein [Rhodovulum visakhapatnamense]OLS46007.1 hypothetical protein BV509_17690 [Rhodovulum sulfidophilum]